MVTTCWLEAGRDKAHPKPTIQNKSKRIEKKARIHQFKCYVKRCVARAGWRSISFKKKKTSKNTSFKIGKGIQLFPFQNN